MLKIYTSYICSSCKEEFVLLSEKVDKHKGYIVCPYCSSKRVRKESAADSLKEVMQERSYRRVNGVMKQR